MVAVSVTLTPPEFDLVADVARIQALTETLPTDLATAAGDVGPDAVLQQAVMIRGGSLTMSNNKARYSRLDALPIQRGEGAHAEVEIVATPRGAWHLVNYGARPHEIKRKKRKGRGALKFEGSYASKVNHPGTAGTSAWDLGVEAAEPEIDRVVQAAFDAALAGMVADGNS